MVRLLKICLQVTYLTDFSIIFWNFCLKKYFLLFFAEFELLMFYNNTVKISELNSCTDQAELVENLPPSDLPYTFLHNLHLFYYGKSENI